ncbi:MAG: hypothetical protein OXR66_04730 [Candidatus Woesearchaeota archaeon]|nr:hypothetical protein [Candidatus Woesearchaeota archaeon]
MQRIMSRRSVLASLIVAPQAAQAAVEAITSTKRSSRIAEKASKIRKLLERAYPMLANTEIPFAAKTEDGYVCIRHGGDRIFGAGVPSRGNAVVDALIGNEQFRDVYFRIPEIHNSVRFRNFSPFGELAGDDTFSFNYDGTTTYKFDGSRESVHDISSGKELTTTLTQTDFDRIERTANSHVDRILGQVLKAAKEFTPAGY